jgi:hypothetical protein
VMLHPSHIFLGEIYATVFTNCVTYFIGNSVTFVSCLKGIYLIRVNPTNA